MSAPCRTRCVSIGATAAYNNVMENIEEKLIPRELSGIPGSAVIPDYGGYSIVAVPGLIRTVFGDRVSRAGAVYAAVEHAVKRGIEKVVLLVLDGVGYDHLQRLLAEYPDLHLHRLIGSGTMIPITSVFPPTTVSALTSYSTGLTPQEHGMVGYRLYLKETSAITNMIRLSLLGNGEGDSALEAGIDADTFLGAPTIYSRLGRVGVESHILLGKYIAKSGLSSIIYDGKEKLHPVVNFSDMLVLARRLLQNARGRTFLSLYWGGTDAIAHTYGPWTEEFTAELRAIDAAIGRELIGRVEKTLIIISSDHGFVPMRESDYHDIFHIPEIEHGLILPPVGEPRASYLYLREGTRKRVLAAIDEHLSGGLVAIDSETALSGGLFGIGAVKEAVRDRIGDLIVVSTGNAAILHPYKDAVKLKGMHGGLTRDEMLVPLIVSTL